MHNQDPCNGDKEEAIGSDGGLVTEDEANKYADEYIKRLEERYLNFELLLTSGYF